MTNAPTRATGSATTANDSIDTWTPAVPAMPAMSRFELVPMRVIEPASVVTWATGSSTSRAGTSRVCSSSFDAGISMATIGVVFIRPEATPTGTMSRRSDWRAVVTVDSSRHVTRVTIPVETMPFAITSIAATVITPPLLRPAKRSLVGVTLVSPATASPVASARTGGTLPDAIARSVAMTMTAARYIIEAAPRTQTSGTPTVGAG